ncbi:50S ribosomal protein L36 [Zafaria sp. J156]|uniref:50S ribosomal protein L36 n=1 Tax=Zafaria sp. J156 TaxID=3116490 RepID=UPI003FCC3EBD
MPRGAPRRGPLRPPPRRRLRGLPVRWSGVRPRHAAHRRRRRLAARRRLARRLPDRAARRDRDRTPRLDGAPRHVGPAGGRDPAPDDRPGHGRCRRAGRRGRTFVINKANPRLKARQG